MQLVKTSYVIVDRLETSYSNIACKLFILGLSFTSGGTWACDVICTCRWSRALVIDIVMNLTFLNYQGLVKLLFYLAHLLIVKDREVLVGLRRSVHDVHLDKDDRAVQSSEHSDEGLCEIKSRIWPENCVTGYHRVKLELGPTEHIAKEITPNRVLADSSSASLDNVSPYLVWVLNHTACSWYDRRKLYEWQSKCITFKFNAHDILCEGCQYEGTVQYVES